MVALSENFTLEEFTYSETALKKGIPNIPTGNDIKVMKHTCQYLLEPLRALLNDYYKVKVYIKITSGYRCPKLNSAVGGSPTSEHVKGQAADIEARKVIDDKTVIIDYRELYQLIKTWVKQGKLSVNQCIQEHSGTATWVHVSHSAWGRTRDKREFLKYENREYKADKL